jgi:hypothetical protein
MLRAFSFSAAFCEVAMTNLTHPPKETVREYMERRTHAPLDPPPSPDEIRRILG